MWCYWVHVSCCFQGCIERAGNTNLTAHHMLEDLNAQQRRYGNLKSRAMHYLTVCDEKGKPYIQVSQEECARLQESVPYVKLYRYNPKHLCPKSNGYGDNGQRKVWASLVSTYCMPSMTSYLSNAPARQLDIVMQ